MENVKSFADPPVNSKILDNILESYPDCKISFGGQFTSSGKERKIADSEMNLLTPFERIKLAQALKSGYQPIINKLTAKIRDLKGKAAGEEGDNLKKDDNPETESIVDTSTTTPSPKKLPRRKSQIKEGET